MDRSAYLGVYNLKEHHEIVNESIINNKSKYQQERKKERKKEKQIMSKAENKSQESECF